MIGITISADQLRGAPAEVRRWIEGEVVAALGFQGPAAPTQRHEGLAICNVEEAGAILALIQGVVPAVNVFFELGHQGVSVGEGALEAYRLADLLRQARLRSAEQLMVHLDTINAALQRIRGTTEVSLYGLDGRGHCFVATQTRQSISELWKRIIDSSQVPAAAVATSQGERPAGQPQGGDVSIPKIDQAAAG